MNKVRVYLQDEAPTIGSGWREVVVVEENASGVRIKDARTGARKRIKMPLWQEILKTAKSAPVEVADEAPKPVEVKPVAENPKRQPFLSKPVADHNDRAVSKALAAVVPVQKKPVAAKPAKPVTVAKPAKRPVAAARTQGIRAAPSWELFYLEVKNAGKAGLPFDAACKLFPDKTENAVNCLPEAANARLAARGDAVRVKRIKGANRAYVIA